jgi:hypothetical protein
MGMEIAVPQELVTATLPTVVTLLVGHAAQTTTITLTAHVLFLVLLLISFFVFFSFDY